MCIGGCFSAGASGEEERGERGGRPRQADQGTSTLKHSLTPHPLLTHIYLTYAHQTFSFSSAHFTCHGPVMMLCLVCVMYLPACVCVCMCVCVCVCVCVYVCVGSGGSGSSERDQNHCSPRARPGQNTHSPPPLSQCILYKSQVSFSCTIDQPTSYTEAPARESGSVCQLCGVDVRQPRPAL